MVTFEDSISTTGEEQLEGLNNPGGGKNMHSVLEGLGLQPMCISSPNLTKWVKIRNRIFQGLFYFQSKILHCLLIAIRIILKDYLS